MNSREKIHEFVNMARHPEAKDLAEALEMEKLNLKFGHYISVEQKGYGYDNQFYSYKVIGTLKTNSYIQTPVDGLGEKIRGDSENCVQVICCGVDERNVERFRLQDIKFTGRPITAFDVCWALNTKHNPTYYFDLKLYNFNNDTLSQCIKISAHSSKNTDKEGLIYFEAMKKDGTKTFHTEWSDDVRDKLAEFI